LNPEGTYEMGIKSSVEEKEEAYGMAGDISVCHSRNIYRSVCMHMFTFS
jgi:hypothetical protein